MKDKNSTKFEKPSFSILFSIANWRATAYEKLIVLLEMIDEMCPSPTQWDDILPL